MLSRRTVVAGAVSALGGVGRRRPDQVRAEIPPALGAGPRSVLRVNKVIVVGPGGGVFTYDAAGHLRSANVGQTTTDPLTGVTCYAGFSTFNGFGAVISLFSSTLDAQLWYADTGTSTQGALIASVATVAGTDPFGNAYKAGVVSYHASIGFAQLFAGTMVVGSLAGGSLVTTGGGLGFGDATLASAQPFIDMVSPVTSASGFAIIAALGESQDTTKPSQAIITRAGAVTPTTTALLEVQGDVQAGDGLSIGQGAAVQTLVNGSTISTAGITMQPVTAAAAVTGIILQAGTFDGQVITIPSNAGAGNTAQFAASGTSHVALGVAATINPGACAVLVWVASTSLWYFAQ